jgi:predicted DNA-binding protein (MmcQ/YjbR family)
MSTSIEDASDLCAALPASELSYPFGEGAAVYKVVGKVFAVLSEGDKPLLTLKADPEDARALVATYAEVIPGYHMNKKHWISVTLPAHRAPVNEIVRDSYDLVVASLPRAKRPTP